MTTTPAETAELDQLCQRVEELERALAAAREREATLQEQATRLQFVVEGSSDGAWDWNIATNEAYLSARWFEMLGYGPDDLPNNAETWFRLMHPDDAPMVQQVLQEYLAGERPFYKVENRLLCKSGEWLWTMGRGKVVARDADGQPLRMTGTVTDISSRKQAEEALRLSQNLLQGVVEHSPAVIYVRDTGGRFLMVNQNHAALLDREPEDIVGKLDADLFPPEVVAAFRATDKQVIAAGKAVEGEEIVPHADGPHTYLSIKFPLYDEQGKIYATGGISTDITERKRAEREQAVLQEQVIEAQQAALRELSTPLIPITDKVVIMPLIGSIDSTRSQQVMETLLEGVAHYRAETVIIDITGVQVVDTQVASALVRSAQAVKLLGAQVMLTGIRPEVAQTVVGMGAELSGIATRSNLQQAIAVALHRASQNGLPAFA